jgi:hypothetical protein
MTGGVAPFSSLSRRRTNGHRSGAGGEIAAVLFRRRER